jgi:hypothetical protein
MTHLRPHLLALETLKLELSFKPLLLLRLLFLSEISTTNAIISQPPITH